MKINHIKWMERHLKRKQRLRRIGNFLLDGLKFVYNGVRFHYILIISFAFALYPVYDLLQTGEHNWSIFILCFVIFIFGVNLDMRKFHGILHF